MKISKARLMQIIKEEVDADSSPYALYVEGINEQGLPTGSEVTIILYSKRTYQVVGMMSITKTSEPCIPETFEVSTVAVDKRYSRRGLGTKLYKFALAILKDRNGGLTSDHTTGTKRKASIIWNKKIPTIATKKKTSMGNDTFEYPPFEDDDPENDCGEGLGGNIATDHSFELDSSEASEIKKEIEALERNHRMVVASLPTANITLDSLRVKVQRIKEKDPNASPISLRKQMQTMFQTYLIARANMLFGREYQPGEP